MRVKRLYRVTATYPDGRVWRRTYQSLGAAKERRDRVTDLATASSATIDRSGPITWPTP